MFSRLTSRGKHIFSQRRGRRVRNVVALSDDENIRRWTAETGGSGNVDRFESWPHTS